MNVLIKIGMLTFCTVIISQLYVLSIFKVTFALFSYLIVLIYLSQNRNRKKMYRGVDIFNIIDVFIYSCIIYSDVCALE